MCYFSDRNIMEMYFQVSSDRVSKSHDFNEKWTVSCGNPMLGAIPMVVIRALSVMIVFWINSRTVATSHENFFKTYVCHFVARTVHAGGLVQADPVPLHWKTPGTRQNNTDDMSCRFYLLLSSRWFDCRTRLVLLKWPMPFQVRAKRWT